MAKQISDLVVERLIEWGVDTVFGFPGDGIDGLFESLRTHQVELKFIQERHEEAAAFAAVGDAKYTGRLGVCCATSGSGGVHLLNGLYDAKCGLQSVLAITGHTFSDLVGMDYQQDADLDKPYMDVAVFSERVMSAPHAVNVVDMAVRSAYGRRGVAHICIPKDIQEWKVSDDHRSNANILRHSGDDKVGQSATPAASILQNAADIINAGSKVVVFCGRGAIGCSEEITQLEDTVGGPVVRALLVKQVIPDRSASTTRVAANCGAKGYTIERPEDAEHIVREALAHKGPTVVQAVVDPNEPPIPGKINTEQELHFSKALARGQKDALKIVKTISIDKFREVI